MMGVWLTLHRGVTVPACCTTMDGSKESAGLCQQAREAQPQSRSPREPKNSSALVPTPTVASSSAQQQHQQTDRSTHDRVRTTSAYCVTGLDDMTEAFDALVKIVIIGDTSVGKTCLILRYTQDIYRENFLSTIGVDFKTKQIDYGSKRLKLQIWDTAGQERYNTIRKGFYRGAKGVIIVYDITKPDTFGSLTKWVTDITENVGDHIKKPPILILGNKCDLECERKVSTLSGQQAAHQFNTKFAEVSARTGAGVEAAFSALVSDIAKALESSDKKHRDHQSIRLHSASGQENESDCMC